MPYALDRLGNSGGAEDRTGVVFQREEEPPWIRNITRPWLPVDLFLIQAVLDLTAANDFRLQDMLLLIITGELMRNR